jgi:hypothetical protein
MLEQVIWAIDDTLQEVIITCKVYKKESCGLSFHKTIYGTLQLYDKTLTREPCCEYRGKFACYA